MLVGNRLGIPMPMTVIGEDITLWWAEIGKVLIEQQPEFRPGRGRQPGSKNKSTKTVVEESTVRQRRRREKRQASALNKRQRRDDWVQIGNQTYLLPKDVVASLEPFLIRRDGNSS